MQKNRHYLSRIFILLPVFLLLQACPSSTTTALDNARFQLDHCDPSDTNALSFCQAAIDALTTTLQNEPGNVEAAILASSAYLGLARIDFLQFVAELLEAQNNADADFKEFQDLIGDVETANGQAIDTSQLRLSVTVLDTALTGKSADSDLNDRAFFQLGSVQALETFILPVKLITFDANGDVNPDEIDDAAAAILEQNFLLSDNNLTASGTTDAETLEAMREGYCRCKLSRFGYGAACVRDLMRCELSDTDTEDTEQDYDNDGVIVGDRVSDCDALVNPAGVETCKQEDSTE